MEGYSGQQEVPEYRVIQGELVAQNPITGLIPFFVADQEVLQLMTRRCERSPVGVIQNALDGDNAKSTGYFIARFPQNVVLPILKAQDYPPLVPFLKLNRMAYVRIIDSVRNAILDWSLKLEEDGILGEGMSFTSQEKELANQNESELAPIINIICVEKMIASSIQQMSPHSNQSGISG